MGILMKRERNIPENITRIEGNKLYSWDLQGGVKSQAEALDAEKRLRNKGLDVVIRKRGKYYLVYAKAMELNLK